MLQMDLYTYDKYTKEEIEGLAVGSKVSICGEDVAVNKVEKDGTDIYINGGYLEGGEDGYYFSLMEDGTYTAGNGTPYNLFYITGNAAMPFPSGTITYIDESDDSAGQQLVDKKPSELSAFFAEETKEIGYVPENTTVTIKDGAIAVIKRGYMQ